jgi:3-isopropylmalate dehydratase small subunit
VRSALLPDVPTAAEAGLPGFIRRALSQGLPVIVLPGITGLVADGDRISVDLATGEIRLADGRTAQARPFSDRMLAIWRAGSLVESLRQEFSAEQQETR